MSRNDDLERKLSELLEDGDMEQGDNKDKEIRQISPKYEIRIQTTLDPIVEETLRYRKIAYELDDRYDRFLERAGKSHAPATPRVQRTAPGPAADRNKSPGQQQERFPDTGNRSSTQSGRMLEWNYITFRRGTMLNTWRKIAAAGTSGLLLLAILVSAGAGYAKAERLLQQPRDRSRISFAL